MANGCFVIGWLGCRIGIRGTFANRTVGPYYAIKCFDVEGLTAGTSVTAHDLLPLWCAMT